MTRTSGMGLIAAIILLAAPEVAQAQQNLAAPPRGTNSAGTAQSSGRPHTRHHRQRRLTTGSGRLGSGHAGPPATSDANAAISAEDDIVGRRIKSICRGC